MEKKEKLQRINDSIQNTMTSAIGIEITDIGDDFISGKMPVDERTVQPKVLITPAPTHLGRTYPGIMPVYLKHYCVKANLKVRQFQAIPICTASPRLSRSLPV